MRNKRINYVSFWRYGGAARVMFGHTDGTSTGFEPSEDRAATITYIIYQRVQFRRGWVVFPGLDGWKAMES